MKKILFFLVIIYTFGCAMNKSQTQVAPIPSVSSDQNLALQNSEKIKEIKLKIASFETQLKEIEKKIEDINKKVNKLISPDSSINEDTKTLILSKISELSAKQENYLMFLADINKELSEIKEKLSQQRIKIKSKKTKKKKSFPKKNKFSEEQIFYERCLNNYRNKKYDNSIKCFKKFVSKYKNSNLVSNAYFWIGESYFKQGNFLKAIDNYDIVLTKYPKSRKVPSALLKEGLAFYYMKDKEGAKIFLQKVINEYPTTPQAYYAKRFIEKFKLK